MLHYDTRADTWYLNGHAVDPYEDFAAIRRAIADTGGAEPQERHHVFGAMGETPDDDPDAELKRAIVRDAIARVWSPEQVDHVVHARLIALAKH